VEVEFYMRSRADGSLVETLTARLYFTNDGNNIYFAAQIFNDDYDAAGPTYGGHDAFGLLFEEDNDGSLGSGDNGEACHTYSGSHWYANNDLYYGTTHPSSAHSSHSFCGPHVRALESSMDWWDDFGEGMTNDGTMAWSHTNPVEEAFGHWTFEMMIPLVGTDGDSYDLAVTALPTTLGFKVMFCEFDEEIDGCYPDDPAEDINFEELYDGFTFGDLMIITETAPVGGIWVPVDKFDLFAPYTSLASTIIVATAATAIYFKHVRPGKKER
jgi:hypothetical protein